METKSIVADKLCATHSQVARGAHRVVSEDECQVCSPYDDEGNEIRVTLP